MVIYGLVVGAGTISCFWFSLTHNNNQCPACMLHLGEEKIKTSCLTTEVKTSLLLEFENKKVEQADTLHKI